MVSLLEGFHCTYSTETVPMVSLLEGFHCTYSTETVPMVSLLEGFHCTYSTETVSNEYEIHRAESKLSHSQEYIHNVPAIQRQQLICTG